ncbi:MULTISPECIES: helix-turn-helix transcriptional regulator [unclassified Mesorhizobium]|uniref:helix-turn-helix domain-containing protein n=1 Tax=unclassified Mesorhizobium TaxID=325217 RepID=UPI0009FC32F3|nr:MULTISPECIES: helix-turn-helix transcriptional regulator [unclassified Mesorhizobium]WJI55141.1 helix-turn-helix domain-containing protein [Mesorhizobium sp. C432A]
MDSRTVPSANQSKAARALLNWSRVRLAAKANLSEIVISDLENGYRKPRPHNINALAPALLRSVLRFAISDQRRRPMRSRVSHSGHSRAAASAPIAIF